ncbi:MAG: GAF domain-containing protein [Verrucomicrobiia bacterium]|jgi:adenylate cyclase
MAVDTQKKRNSGGSDHVPGRTMQEQLRQLEMLLNVSRRVAAIETLDDVLGTVVAITTEETGSERGTLWLNDDQTGELYSRIALGTNHREIRILNTKGIAGHVYQTGEGAIIPDAYKDPRFDGSVDRETGFKTSNILAAPIKTVSGQLIGVIQTLNKKQGQYDEQDLHLLEAMTTQAAITLQSRQYMERMKKTREQEIEFLDIVSDVSSELELKPLLQKVMNEAKRMLKADRATLFLSDDNTNELWSSVGTGLQSIEIRFPNHLGIAGTVFTSGESVNIPYAYADLRFNPDFDKKTGYFTRSILCVPVVNKEGKTIGAAQCLNRQGGPFSAEDESRLKAFSAKISLALENAKLFADVQNMKNYNESVLESMTSGVITLDESGKIVTCNAAGLRIMHTAAGDIIEQQSADFFAAPNNWVLDKVKKVETTQEPENSLDAEMEFAGKKITVNLTVVPLISVEEKKLGSMVMIEDISKAKRGKAALSRYLGSALADQLGESGGLKDKITEATVLFSDIRSFTTLTEKLGVEGTVSMLNEYFTVMVDCVEQEGGQLDKFIGDALMAGFGHILKHDDDVDRAVRSAIAMINRLAGFNEQRQARGEEGIEIGIGLNTDRLLVGNIGSEKQSNYTMIGDGVNLAARLESACKQYFARILISENTRKRLKGTYRMRDVDWVVVKGKTEPVAVYEVLDYHTEESFPNLMEALNHFKSGRELYRARKWDKGINAFSETLSLNPEDKLSGMYIDRCKHLQANPPSDDWDGIWVMKSK